MKNTIYIGIDPGNKTGFASWDSGKKKFISIQTMNFWNAIAMIDIARGVFRPPNIHVVIEDCTQNPPVFGIDKTYQMTKGVHSNKLRAVAKHGMNIGTVMEKTSLMIEWLKRNEIPYTAVKPGKKSMTKLKADSFKNITKWEGRTNEHERDAAMLVFGR